MTLRNVEIKGVENSTKTKGMVTVSYSGAHTKGAVWTVNTFPANLTQESRDILRAAKDSIDAGTAMTVAVDISKEGLYWELKQVAKAVAESTTKYAKNSNTSYEGRLNDVEKAQGQQRGNVLTNAVAIVTTKGVKDYATALEDVRAVAQGLLAISKELENEAAAPAAEDAPTQVALEDAYTEAATQRADW